MKKLIYILLVIPLIGIQANDTLQVDNDYYDLVNSIFTIDVNDELYMDSMIVEDSLEIEEMVHLIMDDMPNVVVHQDSSILQLMIDKKLGYQKGLQEVSGFRVQVYTSNVPQVAKNEALRIQNMVQQALDVEVYVLSEPPFWKVRLGNFKTRDDANAYKLIINELFPDLYRTTYVVPDIVTIVH